MKKILLILIIMFSFVSYVKAEDFQSGSGTIDDPYIITTAEELNNVRNYLQESTYFKLGNDIDLTNETREGGTYYNEGLGWDPIDDSDGFLGYFDGNGKTITGLYINRPDETYVGLFGYLRSLDSSANEYYIKDMTLKDVDITGKEYVGALAGYIYDYEFISNIIISGKVSSPSTEVSYTGGIVGQISYTNVKNVINNAKVYAPNSPYLGGIAGSLLSSENAVYENLVNNGEVTAMGYAGGLFGSVSFYHAGITLKNSYNTADIKVSENFVGGLIGDFTSTYDDNYFESVFNIGNVSGNIHVGGLFGHVHSLNIKDSFNAGAIINNDNTDILNGQYIGGIVGSIYDIFQESDNLTNVYNIGCVKGTTKYGYIIGDVPDTVPLTLTNVYSLENSSFDDMVKEETYQGFDFTNTWKIDENANYKYPTLRSIDYSIDEFEYNCSISNDIDDDSNDNSYEDYFSNNDIENPDTGIINYIIFGGILFLIFGIILVTRKRSN